MSHKPEICKNSVIKDFHLIDIILYKSSQYLGKAGFIQFASPFCRMTQNMIAQNLHDRTFTFNNSPNRVLMEQWPQIDKPQWHNFFCPEPAQYLIQNCVSLRILPFGSNLLLQSCFFYLAWFVQLLLSFRMELYYDFSSKKWWQRLGVHFKFYC